MKSVDMMDRLVGVIGCSIAISSCDILHICVFTNMAYSVVARVLPIFIYIYLCSFCAVANCILIIFVSRSSDTFSTPSLIITRAYGQVC